VASTIIRRKGLTRGLLSSFPLPLSPLPLSLFAHFLLTIGSRHSVGCRSPSPPSQSSQMLTATRSIIPSTADDPAGGGKLNVRCQYSSMTPSARAHEGRRSPAADGVDSKVPKHHPPPPPHPHNSSIKHRWARARLPPAPPYWLQRPQPSHWLQPLDSGRYGLAASVAAAAPPRIPAVAVAYSDQECQRRHQHLQACCGTGGRAHARLW